MRLVFFGSGAFGLPTLRRLVALHDVALVVSQPDRPAGRQRRLTPTPIAQFAQEEGIPVFKPERPNEAESINVVREMNAEVFVVIAYGHKLSPALLEGTFAINLHASLLPKYRGAAPINWAMIHDEPETGVSVITLAQRMDAGGVLAQLATPIHPWETAGELHDRLSEMGPAAILNVLERHAAGEARALPQNESLATPAPKLSKADGQLDFSQSARLVRARIHGLTPWPGCTVRLGGGEVKLLRVRDVFARDPVAEPGCLSAEGLIACGRGEGSLQVVEVLPSGGRAMSFEDYKRGHPLPARSICEAV